MTLLQEAIDATTPAERLSALIDICDEPRRRYADLLKAGHYEEALSCLAGEVHDPALGRALAANPNLSREDWVRMLELEPGTAIRNSVFSLMLVPRERIIEHSHELIALGALADYVQTNPNDTAASASLVELIRAGLPDLDRVETYGGNFGEMRYTSMPTIAANRYCWNDDELWHMRAVAIHRAGVSVMDCLQALQGDQAKAALEACSFLGIHLGEPNHRWKTYVRSISLAPRESDAFSYTLYTEAGDDADHQQHVLGWEGPDGVVWWRCSPRPGFLPGYPCANGEVPAQLRGIPLWETTDTDTSGETNYLGVYVENGTVILVSEGGEACDGCAVLSGCTLETPFPESELARLRALFGEHSDAVQFGSDPQRAVCTECAEFSLEWYAQGECEHCGAVREDADR